MFEELEVVELVHDIKDHNLKKGDTGTVVFVYKSASGRSRAYEVEFVAPNGRTIAVLTLMPEDLRLYVNRDENLFYRFNAPVYTSNVTAMASAVEEKNNLLNGFFIGIDEFNIKSERNKSITIDIKNFSYPVATL